jgi:hypothetical protein
MIISVLESEYVEPTRPHSSKELSDIRAKMYKFHRLGKTRAFHRHCEHFYLVKENGRKEKEIKENVDADIGHCSVCWKINKTPRRLKSRAENLVKAYCRIFFEEPEKFNYDIVDTESSFYQWLYQEFN